MNNAKEEDYIHHSSIRNTVLLLFYFSVLGIVLGSFISLRLTKSMLSHNDVFYPRINNLSPFPTHESPTSPPMPVLHTSSSFKCSNNCTATTSPHGLEDRTTNHGHHESSHLISDNDWELVQQALEVQQALAYSHDRRKKVAFMFLTRGRLPLRLLWEKFFRGYEGHFSIYLHTSPGYTEEPPEGSVFFGRRIHSEPVEWGRATMMDAERRLLANALLDSSNEWFILLSETCIPLYNFTTIYNYLKGSKHSFVSSFDDPRKVGRGRYSKRMWPLVPLHDWRKGSQWFQVHRKLAVEIVSDCKYYPVFREHCRPPCYIDEHYVPTLVTKLFPELIANRSITWVDWSRGGSHPATFKRRDVSEWLVDRMRHGSSCVYNGKPCSVCFLFARKFEASALGPLLKLAPLLLSLDQGNF